MQEEQSIALSPRHSVTLASEYVGLIKRAPKKDFVIRTLVKREANGNPLVAGELVIAGAETREQHPLAATYPLHFRKTYFPARLHGDPKDEFDRHQRASELVPVPAPIGFTPNVFRSCFLPGKPYSRLSPFGVEPESGNFPLAHELPLESAVGLWRLAEEILSLLLRLHAGGLCHGDAELHNFIVCPAPLEALPIDFEGASEEGGRDSDAWQKLIDADLAPILREAGFLQCALGRQTGKLAELTEQYLARLFKDPKRLTQEIDRQAELTT
jgi:hypothetical protein